MPARMPLAARAAAPPVAAFKKSRRSRAVDSDFAMSPPKLGLHPSLARPGLAVRPNGQDFRFYIGCYLRTLSLRYPPVNSARGFQRARPCSPLAKTEAGGDGL